MNNPFLEFLRDLAGELKAGQPPLSEQTLASLEDTQETVRALYLRYQQPAPTGAEEVRETMREALQLYFQAIELLLDVSDKGDVELLAVAMAKAEEASDLLEQVEYLVSEAQQALANSGI